MSGGRPLSGFLVSVIASVFDTSVAWLVGVDDDPVFASRVGAFAAALADGASVGCDEPYRDTDGVSQACSASGYVGGRGESPGVPAAVGSCDQFFDSAVLVLAQDGVP